MPRHRTPTLLVLSFLVLASAVPSGLIASPHCIVAAPEPLPDALAPHDRERLVSHHAHLRSEWTRICAELERNHSACKSVKRSDGYLKQKCDGEVEVLVGVVERFVEERNRFQALCRQAAARPSGSPPSVRPVPPIRSDLRDAMADPTDQAGSPEYRWAMQEYLAAAKLGKHAEQERAGWKLVLAGNFNTESYLYLRTALVAPRGRPSAPRQALIDALDRSRRARDGLSLESAPLVAPPSASPLPRKSGSHERLEDAQEQGSRARGNASSDPERAANQSGTSFDQAVPSAVSTLVPGMAVRQTEAWAAELAVAEAMSSFQKARRAAATAPVPQAVAARAAECKSQQAAWSNLAASSRAGP